MRTGASMSRYSTGGRAALAEETPAEFAKYMQSEIDKWRKVIKAAGIQPS